MRDEKEALASGEDYLRESSDVLQDDTTIRFSRQIEETLRDN